jgi:RNA polymerase sigma-70 factor, ECF subfamily
MIWSRGRGGSRATGGSEGAKTGANPSAQTVAPTTGGQSHDGRGGWADVEPTGGQVLDDEQLARRSLVDAEAFGVLYDRYCAQIYRYVRRRIGDHEAAEDVTAEVFFKALRAIATFRPEAGPFSGWLYRIAGNAVIDYLRARHVTASLDVSMDAPDQAAPVDDLVVDRMEAARVWTAIDSLGEAQRTAVMLRYGRDLPIAEIAAQMGRTEGAIKLLLNRGMAAVRTQLRAAEGEERR